MQDEAVSFSSKKAFLTAGAIDSRDLAALRRRKELISSVPKETGGINNLAEKTK
jgi:hypothetical protein